MLRSVERVVLEIGTGSVLEQFRAFREDQRQDGRRGERCPNPVIPRSRRSDRHYSRKAACTARKACWLRSDEMTTESLISLVEIMSMLTFSRAKMSKILAAIPE